MATRLTLEMKKQISEEVTNETARCMSIVKEMGKDMSNLNLVLKAMVEGSPYLNFHPELKQNK